MKKEKYINVCKTCYHGWRSHINPTNSQGLEDLFGEESNCNHPGCTCKEYISLTIQDKR